MVKMVSGWRRTQDKFHVRIRDEGDESDSFEALMYSIAVITGSWIDPYPLKPDANGFFHVATA